MGHQLDNQAYQQRHAEVIDLLPAYALWAVDETERQLVDDHLKECAGCRSELGALRHVAHQLPLAVEERAPSPGRRAQLLARAGQTVAPLPIEHHSRPDRPQHRWWHRPSPSLMAASLLLALSLGLGGWNLNLQGELNVRQQQTERLLAREAEQQRQIGQLQTQLASLRGQPSVQLLSASGTANAPAVTGQLYVITQQQIAFLSLEQLPPLPPGQTYQVWFIQNGRAIDAGLLVIGREQAIARLQADLSRYQAVAVSREPNLTGSPQPTGPVVVEAPIRLPSL